MGRNERARREKVGNQHRDATIDNVPRPMAVSNFSLHHLAAEFTQDCTQVSILGSRQNTSREPIHRTIFLHYQYWKLAMNATQKGREEEMECMGETGLPNIITSCCNNKKEGPPAAIIISNNNTSRRWKNKNNDWFFDPISNVMMGVLPVAFG